MGKIENGLNEPDNKNLEIMATKLFETTGGDVLESPLSKIYKFDSTTNFLTGKKLIKNIATGKIVIKADESAVYAVDKTV